MSRPVGFIGYEFGDDDLFIQQMMDEKRNNAEMEKQMEAQKNMLECMETMPEDGEPVPARSLNFEEAFHQKQMNDDYQSPYKNIPFLKEDVATVNTMSHCPPDDIAKLIRNIQNSVYTLGLEEARQCRRGKLLDVLKISDSEPRRLQPTTPNTEARETPSTSQ